MQMEVSLRICTKMLGKYLECGHCYFLPYSPVLGQHDKLLEPRFRRRLRQESCISEIKYAFLICSSSYNRLVSVRYKSLSFRKYTGHTQNNGAVLIVNTIKAAPFFCVCPVLERRSRSAPCACKLRDFLTSNLRQPQ
jgi:hypothetical protein